MATSSPYKTASGKSIKQTTPRKASSSLARTVERKPLDVAKVRNVMEACAEAQSYVVIFGENDFRTVYSWSPQCRIDAIKRGVTALSVAQIAVTMDMPKDNLWSLLRLPRSTMCRKEKHEEALSPEESERVLGIAAIIGQVEAMVCESGNPKGFDAAKWVSNWLDTPVPALGGKRPAEYLDTVEGQKLVSRILAMSQSGAYA
jgi:putative toxin-antitoxin system antitoxin component (TIGR02293 family)